MTKKKIKQLPSFERPREKLLRYGSSRLTEAELLAIIFGTGSKKEDVVSLSKKVLERLGEERLTELKMEDLSLIKELGQVKKCQLLALVELGRRWFGEKRKRQILQPKDIFEELREFRDKKKEYFFVFYLDTRNTEIKRELISVGSLNSNIAHPREIFEPAIRYLSAQIILVHNHPSGDSQPSEEDLELTRKIVEGGKILGIEVLDHVIITKDSYFSFAENKLI